MKRILFLLLLAIGFGIPSFSQDISHGKVVEGLSFESKILKQPVSYALYFPPDYDASQRRYPVVYLLHGYSDNQSAWIQFGEINRIMDAGIASGTIPPMILVMPNAKVTWYVNDYTGKVRYEDMFIQEFIPFIDASYNTRPTREFRAVAGLSMGGYGALIYGFKHPDLFSACAGLSAAVLTEKEIKGRLSTDTYDLDSVYGPMVSDSLPQHWYSNSVLTIIENIDPAKVSNLRIWLDCGDDDHLARGNSALHILLLDKGIAHEYRVRDGGHTWNYWRTGIGPALEFVGQGFHR
ncbi:MAG TPA: alpha/beta hydrolase-fold protein [Williamwhitmania sp.]|nr:alpha/beta hydrolase-fold protein [Williamwhitmania sp.]